MRGKKDLNIKVLNQCQQDILIGTLLGDGYLGTRGSLMTLGGFSFRRTKRLHFS